MMEEVIIASFPLGGVVSTTEAIFGIVKVPKDVKEAPAILSNVASSCVNNMHTKFGALHPQLAIVEIAKLAAQFHQLNWPELCMTTDSLMLFIQPCPLPAQYSSPQYSFCTVGMIVIPSFEELAENDVFFDILGVGFDNDGGIALTNTAAAVQAMAPFLDTIALVLGKSFLD